MYINFQNSMKNNFNITNVTLKWTGRLFLYPRSGWLWHATKNIILSDLSREEHDWLNASWQPIATFLFRENTSNMTHRCEDLSRYTVWGAERVLNLGSWFEVKAVSPSSLPHLLGSSRPRHCTLCPDPILWCERIQLQMYMVWTEGITFTHHIKY